MKKSELRKLIKEELLKERKYEPTDPRAEMIEIVYDTLFNNTENPQFNVKKVKKQWVDSGKGTIEFEYKLDEKYKSGGGVEKTDPVVLKVKMNFDIK